MSAPDGGPAFPSVLEWRTTVRGDDVTGCNDNAHDGMTLRDYFAAKALPAVIAGYAIANSTTDRPQVGTDHLPANCASHAYRIADAMLEARSKR